MATIKDDGDNWHLIIDQNAAFVQDIIEPAKGYTARLGENKDTGKHVVMDVHYKKDKYTINDVMKFAEKTRNCPKCQALDKDKLNIDSIELPTVTQEKFSDPALTQENQAMQSNKLSLNQVQTQPQRTNLKEAFSNIFFDAYLTNPGKYFLAMMMQDDKLMESALPKTDADLPQFMDEMVDFMSGKIEFVRNPDEIKDYLSILKKNDDDKGTKSSQRRKKSSIPATVIY